MGIAGGDDSCDREINIGVPCDPFATRDDSMGFWRLSSGSRVKLMYIN